MEHNFGFAPPHCIVKRELVLAIVQLGKRIQSETTAK